jgi:lysophospholipase L1-like esterase
MKKKWLTGLFVLLLGISSFSLQDDEIIFFLVGDSTLANKPYGESNPEKGWGQVFPLYFKEGIRFENHAMNGRSAKSFRAEGKWDAL